MVSSTIWSRFYFEKLSLFPSCYGYPHLGLGLGRKGVEKVINGESISNLSKSSFISPDWFDFLAIISGKGNWSLSYISKSIPKPSILIYDFCSHSLFLYFSSLPKPSWSSQCSFFDFFWAYSLSYVLQTLDRVTRIALLAVY